MPTVKMSQKSLPPEWLRQLSDPCGVLGISVAADDRRILKRYRQLAKLLHPDRYPADDANKQLATQVFARLVNPAYEKLKQQESRAETVAVLRLRSRSFNCEAIETSHALALELMRTPAKEAEIFYEHAIATLAESQYHSLDGVGSLTQQLSELNLLYLRLKMGELLLREKRTGLIAAAQAKPIQFIPVSKEVISTPAQNYAHSHYQRATEYAKQKNWAKAVQELRDAIKLDGNSSRYHALLGFVYIQQNLTGMATVHIRQALKLNPEDPLALKCAPSLSLQPSLEEKPTGKNSKLANLLSFLGAKKGPQVKC